LVPECDEGRKENIFFAFSDKIFAASFRQLQRTIFAEFRRKVETEITVFGVDTLAPGKYSIFYSPVKLRQSELDLVGERDN
jgi:hypothetical protein